MNKAFYVLDGGMGRELKGRDPSLCDTEIWSSAALLKQPSAVTKVHEDYIAAGADIITTSNYAATPFYLSKVNKQDRVGDLTALSATCAVKARTNAKKEGVLIAGSLPPLSASYRPDKMIPVSEMVVTYDLIAKNLAKDVDIFIAETMSHSTEMLEALKAGYNHAQGKPILLSITLDDTNPEFLSQKGQSLKEALDNIEKEFGFDRISGLLVNCCSIASITSAVPMLKEAIKGKNCHLGAYANAFEPMPEKTEYEGSGFRAMRDISPEDYLSVSKGWNDERGFTIIGGCCGIGPSHIKELAKLKK